MPLISGQVANSEVLQLSAKLVKQPSKTMVGVLFDWRSGGLSNGYDKTGFDGVSTK
jgi:hypothetical protein